MSAVIFSATEFGGADIFVKEHDPHPSAKSMSGDFSGDTAQNQIDYSLDLGTIR